MDDKLKVYLLRVSVAEIPSAMFIFSSQWSAANKTQYTSPYDICAMPKQ